MSKQVRRLLRENNEMEKLLSEDGRSVMTDIAVYLRGADIRDIDQEQIRRDIIQMLIDGEGRGVSPAEVVGEDYRVFCDNILAEIPHLGMRQKMLAAARDTLLGMTALIVIWCCKCILDYLTEGGTLVFPVTAGSLIAAVLILAAANIIILYLTHDPFDHSRARNVRCTVLILLLAALSICSNILVTVELFRIHLGAAAAAAVILYAIYRTADRYTDTF